MKTIHKVLLALGVGYASYSVGRTYFFENSNEVVPLKNFSKELDTFDKKPRDSVLSTIESEDFLQPDRNKTLSPEKIAEVKSLIGSLKATRHVNTQESARNLQRGLEFVLIRERINRKDIDQEENLTPNKQERDKELDYSDFYRYAFLEEKPLIKKVILQNKSDKLTAVFMDGSTNSVRIPQDNAAIKQLADKLTEKSIQVEITSQDSSIVSELLFFAIFPGIPLLILYLMLSRGGKGGFKRIFGISSVNALKEKNSKITFKDVAGIDEVKEELKEVVDFLKDSKKYDSLGAKVPKGVLLVGPPGTGKTLCAKAIAGEANVPFFGLSGADFVEMFVGVGAARVRDLFSQAKKNAPCLVFIDELDAVGRQRGTGLGSGHDEREQTLNQLLVNMDGFDSREGIVVIAATNRPDVLDTALLRPGRFDRQIVVDRPDIKGREAILAVHAKGKPFADDANLKIIAQRTAGFTGADLANLLNEAALLAGRKSKSMISMDELEEAIDKVIAGPEKKSRIISPEDKKLTAYHEGGHALVAHFEKNSDPLHKVTIIPRGMALGLTMTLPEEDHLSYTKAQLLSRIKVMLGGRVAEEIIFGEENVTTGAENDLKRATELLNKMITKFGMSDELGLLTFGDSNEQVFLGRDFANNTKNYSESVASKIDAEMKKIITELHKEVKDLLLQKRKHLDAVAQVLLEKEAVDKEEFIGVIEEVDKGTFKFEG